MPGLWRGRDAVHRPSRVDRLTLRSTQAGLITVTGSARSVPVDAIMLAVPVFLVIQFGRVLATALNRASCRRSIL